MSKFKTTVLVDIAAVKAMLPAGASVTAVTLNADLTGVDVLWEHDNFHTPYTFPVEWQDPGGKPPDVVAVSGKKTELNSPVGPTPADAPRAKAGSRPPNMKRRP